MTIELSSSLSKSKSCHNSISDSAFESLRVHRGVYLRRIDDKHAAFSSSMSDKLAFTLDEGTSQVESFLNFYLQNSANLDQILCDRPDMQYVLDVALVVIAKDTCLMCLIVCVESLLVSTTTGFSGSPRFVNHYWWLVMWLETPESANHTLSGWEGHLEVGNDSAQAWTEPLNCFKWFGSSGGMAQGELNRFGLNQFPNRFRSRFSLSLKTHSAGLAWLLSLLPEFPQLHPPSCRELCCCGHRLPLPGPFLPDFHVVTLTGIILCI